MNLRIVNNKTFFFTVPIIPEFLYDLKHPNATLSEHLDEAGHHAKKITTTIAPAPVNCPCAQNSSNLEFLPTSSSIG